MRTVKNKNTQKMKGQINLVFLTIALLMGLALHGQQDPQYTQYMYITLNVIPAYSGSRGHLSA